MARRDGDPFDVTAIRNFAGLNNINAPERLEATEFVAAENIDLDTAGRMSRRAGRTSLFAGTSIRSLWSPRDGRMALFADGTDLCAVTPTRERRVVAAGILNPLAEVGYASINNTIYFSDGFYSGKIRTIYDVPSAWERWIPAYNNRGQATVAAGYKTQTDVPSPVELTYRDDIVDLPLSSRLAYFSGRMFTVHGSTLMWSEPMMYGSCRPQFNFLVFPAEIRVLAPVESALFVVADQTYVLQGKDPKEWNLRTRMGYTAAKQVAAEVPVEHFGDFPPDIGALWMSDKGLVLGLPDGSIYNLMEKRVAVPAYDKAVVAYREEAGKRQALAISPSKGTANSLRFGDEFSAEIRRNGVIIQ